MSNNSKIEWTEATWNPVTGCDWVSPGCDHCYARTLAKRMKAMGSIRYQVDGFDRALDRVTPGFGVTLHRDKVDEPLRRKKPTMYFVNSMSDLFHPEVPTTFIHDVFEVMREARQHTFQVLTKRPRRMRDLLNHDERWVRDPSPNVWLGTSVENQEWAIKRVPLLQQTPAVVRFLSCEPLIGRVDLAEFMTEVASLHWVIVGGESGTGARPVDPTWVRLLRDQCRTHGVPYFFKQWGGRTSKAGGRDLDGRSWEEMPSDQEAPAVG